METRIVKLPYEVWHGTQNSFVIVEESNLRLLREEQRSNLAQEICPHLGVDGLLIVEPLTSRKVRMTLYNPDGSRAEMCGNGVRCVAAYTLQQGWVKSRIFTIVTDAGNKKIKVLDGQYRVNMEPPIFEPDKIPVVGSTPTPSGIPSLYIEKVPDQYPLRLWARCISMGNPHAVIYVSSLEWVKLYDWGPYVEKYSAFPERINVHFVEWRRDSPHQAKVLVWERGVGPTKACGTGACAVTAVGILSGVLTSPVEVELPGGILTIEWDGTGDMYMTGPAEKVADSVTYLYKPAA